MRILFLAPQPFMTQRGTPLATKMLLETLSKRGYFMDVLIYPEGEDIIIDRCTFTRVPALPGLANIKPGFSLKKLCADIVMFPMIVWKMMRNRYDLVIAVEESAYFAMILKPIFRVPYVFDVDSSIPEQINDKFDPPSWVNKLLERSEGAASMHALGAIACCRELGRTITGYAPDLPVQVLEDITMLGDMDAAHVPDDLDIDVPIVMYVGNLESYQGVGLLVDAFARVDLEENPAHLVVIGGSADHISAHQAQANSLGIPDAVTFLGPRPVDWLTDYLKGAAITVSPRTQGRNTPMKIYSYLDSGRALLATRLTTHTQVLDDEISMLVEPTPDDMARGLRELLQNVGMREKMGQLARERVAAEFSPDAYARKVATFFDNVVEPKLGLSTKNEPAS